MFYTVQVFIFKESSIIISDGFLFVSLQNNQLLKSDFFDHFRGNRSYPIPLMLNAKFSDGLLFFLLLIIDKLKTKMFQYCFSGFTRHCSIATSSKMVYARSLLKLSQQSFINRSSRPEVFLGKGVLKICSKFTENTQNTLRYGCSPVKLLYVFRIPFPRNTTGWLILDKQDPPFHYQYNYFH